MTQPAPWFQSPERSRLMRVVAIAALVLLLRIPVAMIRGLIEERSARRIEAEHEVTSKWGNAQTLSGPLLIVPYEVRWTSKNDDGSVREHRTRRTATFLPETLDIDGTLAGQVRRRGIFDVPVYGSELRVSGRFAAPDFSDWDVDPKAIQWDRAVLSLGISDARVIQDTPTLRWREQEVAFQPGAGAGAPQRTAIHAPLDLGSSAAAADFEFALRLNGSGGIAFAPLGGQTRVHLAGDWPHPSFQGAWLPAERSVSPEGFDARWSVSSLGRSFPQRWNTANGPGDALEAVDFGVALATPIDPYRLAERSVKYDALFLGLTFGALWLFEVLAGVRVHAIQYLMLGGAMTLFYLLQLAFSEHLGFGVAYALASGGVVLLVAGYALAILGSRKRGLAIGGLVAGLHAALYVLLHDQDHALLIGSLGLFAGLAVVMWLTRRVDWYAPLPDVPSADPQVAP